MRITSVILLLIVAGCSGSKTEPESKLNDIFLSIEVPSDPQLATGALIVRIHNKSGHQIEVVRDSYLAMVTQPQPLKLWITTREGLQVDQKEPLPCGLPHLPTEKDWLRMAPGASAPFMLQIGGYQIAHRLKPSETYLIHLELKFRGYDQPVGISFPYEFTETWEQHVGRPMSRW